jgi:hypothetical protein
MEGGGEGASVDVGLSTTVKISICTIRVVGCNFATVLETRALLHPTK